MNTNIYVIIETYNNGFRDESLDFISLASVFSAISVIISKNPIVSVLFLIFLFLSIATYLIISGLGFIGLSYLLVYVGAVSILFLFILMLINVRISELSSENNKSLPLAITTPIFFIYAVYHILPYNNHLEQLKYSIKDVTSDNNNYLNGFFSQSTKNGEIFLVTGNSWDGNLAENTHITSLGNIMYTSYSIWLIITSVILLLAMVGCIVITIKQKPV